MRIFTCTQMDINDLIAIDLSNEAISNFDEPVEAYSIKIGDAEVAEAIFFPALHRLGIAWGADATWADVTDVESGIDMYLNDAEQWEARN